jgi:large repetitive protein
MSNKNRFRHHGRVLAVMISILGCLLPMQNAHPGIVLVNGGNYSTGLYEETVVDMRVKVMGGEIKIDRQWKDGRWIFNPSWADLKFFYPSVNSDLQSPGESTPSTINRNTFSYRQKNNTSSIYVYDKRKTIVSSETGYRWSDREGDWINYDQDGKIQVYGNRNNVTVSFGRDAQGRIETVKDHFNKAIIAFAYDTNSRIVSVTDYSGRSVVYTWSGNDLVKVKDVRGFEWQYAYQTMIGYRVMIRKTDPEGRVINVNHVIVGGGQVCVQTDVGKWVYNDEKNRWEQQGGRCLRWVMQPQSVIFTGISDAISKQTEHRYFYDADNKIYSKTTISNGRRVIQKINLKGEILGEEVNGETQSEAVISTDRRRRVVTNRHAQKTAYEYDEYENQTKITYPDNIAENWTYDQYSNVLTHTNGNGVTTRNEYDARGNLIRTIEALGTPVERITEYAYDEYGNIIEKKQLGDSVTQEAITKWTYDEYGNIKTRIDPEGHKTEYTNDVLGNVLTEKDPRGNTWTDAYDAAGNLLSELTPLNHLTQYVYDKVGNRIQIIDALNNRTTFQYDARNRLIRETDTYGHHKIHTFNPQDQLISTQDEDGKLVRFEYDSFNRLAKIIDGNNNTTVFEYGEGNADINQLSRARYPTYTLEFYYDLRGRQVLVRQILGEDSSLDTRFAYDPVGNRKQIIDPAGRIQKFEYDALNRLVSAENIAGDTVASSYDARDNLLSVTNENNVGIRRYQYDRTNLQTHEIWPEGQTYISKYDPNGNLSEKTDAKGQVARFTHDKSNRLLKTEYFVSATAAQPAKVIDYSYNAVDSLTSYNDGRTQGTYSYDNRQRLLSEAVNYGPFSLGYAYTYRPNGRKESLTYPDNTTIQYGYDPGNRLSRIAIPGQGNITINSYKWHAPEKMTLPGGVSQQNSYDAILRLQQILAQDPAGNTLMNYQYTYDLAGNITGKNTDNGAYIYSYDAADRLTEVDNAVLPDESYTYDAAGNRLTSADISGQWQYNDADQLLEAGSSQYEYDLNGNLTRRSVNGEVQILHYDFDNRLAEIRREDNTLVAEYGYDPFGRRLSKTVGGVTTYFYYNDQGLIGEYDASGASLQLYGYESDGLWGTDPVFTRVGAEYHYYLNDHLGTPQKLVNISGSVQWSIDYTAFGETAIDPLSTISNPLRFPGQYFDQESGLYYNYHRYYDPALGRYISTDPLGLSGGLNVYLYANSAPTVYFDNEGLVGVAGAVAGALCEALTNPDASLCTVAVAALSGALGPLGGVITGALGGQYCMPDDENGCEPSAEDKAKQAHQDITKKAASKAAGHHGGHFGARVGGRGSANRAVGHMKAAKKVQGGPQRDPDVAQKNRKYHQKQAASHAKDARKGASKGKKIGTGIFGCIASVAAGAFF